ncbi:transcriptional regulator of nitric oxide reductase [Litoreibacter halocynthiae]|uniref:Transcriptional regulator of nitric oxide reductase n=1 Tax=Litoreibacter halocynthiae TaxID=1242689 RepID=A0A4V3EWT7_9RHOB|nr:4Fe-4S binding protein [Litoreibacter halocynthiae]TDT77385.1 transcriptional regulator of nitric oxide reductase [Litoreibacter halocynthiae]
MLGGKSLTALVWGAALWVACAVSVIAEPLTRETLAPYIVPPMSLGEPLNDQGVWQLLNSGGAEAGYVFETEPMAPLPGFSGAPINMLVVLDLDGRFLDVKLISHNEPIFVSGLGEAPFHKFFEQYRGHSISDSLVVGTPYGGDGGGSALVYLDGVTKATASVRIAHESLLAAALKVAREKMNGISTGPPAYPNLEYSEPLDWAALVEQGIATRKVVTNAELNAVFEGTLWEDDDPEAQDDPNGTYLDLWIIDLGPPSIAKAVLSKDSYEELREFMSISTTDEPVLLVETARHGLITEDFVRNTAPDLISADQGGFPVAFRDADIYVEMNKDLPEDIQDGAALILRTDRRLGFDPAADWTLQVKALRSHGVFQPEVGSVTLTATHTTPERFYSRPEVVKPTPPWVDALRNRATDLVILCVFLAGLVALLGLRLNRLAGHKFFTPIRLGILAFVTVFIGWWGQGQLSIATPMAVLRTAKDSGSFAFLLYDPFSLVIWAVTILGFVLWGRGLFCGWLCPFGAMQEFAHHLGRLLRLPQIEPSVKWDHRLKWLKYAVLAGLVAIIFTTPARLDKAIEVEPFKTAITTYFIREWYYVAYAVGLLLLSMVLFKGFCRYLCPLGAVMAIGGLVRGRDWIARRTECGSPCQLCRVKCNYGAIKKTGEIEYSECFQCLDCVTIHDDETQCVPLILAAKGRKIGMAAE